MSSRMKVLCLVALLMPLGACSSGGNDDLFPPADGAGGGKATELLIDPSFAEGYYVKHRTLEAVYAGIDAAFAADESLTVPYRLAEEGEVPNVRESSGQAPIYTCPEGESCFDYFTAGDGYVTVFPMSTIPVPYTEERTATAVQAAVTVLLSNR